MEITVFDVLEHANILIYIQNSVIILKIILTTS